ncbi:DUF3108 domain-containing protein [Aestuariibacter sp. A3R04]|nr:DUF3108 domain-containing protein [Aestuariibacter sp. A3R04]
MPTIKRLGQLIGLYLGLLLVSGPTSAHSGFTLIPFEAKYTAYKWNDDVGSVTIKLTPLAKNQYSLTYASKVSKFFLSDERFEHSIFFYEDGSITPYQYFYRREGTGPDKNLEVKFSTRPNKHIEISDSETVVWQGETDNQLYRLDLAKQLASGADSAAYDFINYRGEKKSYGIEVMGKATLSLPYGKLNTIKVKLIRQNSSRETFAWFAPSLNYNLVRLQQFKDGEEQGDIRLLSYQTL